MSQLPLLKVISNGPTTQGTKIVDIETGQEIRGVTRIELTAECNDVWRARVDLLGLAVDVDVMKTATTFDSTYIEYPRVIDLREWAAHNL